VIDELTTLPAPRHAVVILSFNAEATIAELLAAIQQQESLGELIDSVWLFDDASSDRTVDVAQRAWESTVPLQVIVAEKNQTQWPNLNQALRRVQSPSGWVLLVHDDDLVKPFWASCMSAAIARCGPRVATVSTSWDTITADGRLEPGEDAPDGSPMYFAGSIGVRTTLMRGCWWHISGCAIRLAALQSIGDFDTRIHSCGDWEWIIRCLASGWEALVYPVSPLLYRKFDDTVGSRSFRTNLDIVDALQIIGRYRSYLSRPAYTALLLRRVYHLLRRTARRLIRGQPRAATRNLTLAGRILASLVAAPANTSTRSPLPNGMSDPGVR
jgi:glycosyltransferase involved in cell wall biosynthesis